MKQLLKKHSVELCGFDVPPSVLDRPVTEADLNALYIDPSTPFGHELVLASLLLGVCPWEKFARDPVYEGLFPTAEQARELSYAGPVAPS